LPNFFEQLSENKNEKGDSPSFVLIDETSNSAHKVIASPLPAEALA
jgi:hypothetical protein